MDKFVSPTLTIAAISLVVGIIVLTQLALRPNNAIIAAPAACSPQCEFLFNTDDWTVVRCKR